MGVKVIIRKWGNSLGVVFPKEFVKERKLKIDQEIVLELAKNANLEDVFGLVKNNKMSGQEFKNMVRKGWTK